VFSCLAGRSHVISRLLRHHSRRVWCHSILRNYVHSLKKNSMNKQQAQTILNRFKKSRGIAWPLGQQGSARPIYFLASYNM
jgi:hypothetical protein